MSSTAVVGTFAVGLLCIAAGALRARLQDPAPLPSSLRPQPNAESWADARRELVLQRAREAAPTRVVFVGDSITQGFDDRGTAAWREHFAPLGALNLGCTGDRTEHVSWRLQQAPLTRLQPAHVVLLLGTNNLGHGTSTPAETLAGLVAVIGLLRQQCPDAVLHVHEIFPREREFAPRRGDVLQVNQALRAFVRAEHAREPARAARLVLHAIGDAFVGADGRIDEAVMPDALHLSAASYAVWAAALAPALR